MKISKSMQVPFNDLKRFASAHEKELEDIIARVVQSGWYVLGKEGEAFEKQFAEYVGVPYAVGVNSGTDALAIGLRALDVIGGEVITAGNSATATVAAIRMAGATPVFADIDATYTLDPKNLEKRITPKTKAIVPVHLYGFPADMPAIMAIAKKHGISVLEDSAQAHGATIGGRQVGSFGELAAFSFYPTKNLGALGDGGMVVTRDEALAKRMRRLRAYGEEERYRSVEEGINSRLDEIQAALLSFLLGHLDGRNAKRKAIAEKYVKGITNPLVSLPLQSKDGREGAWHLFVVEVDDREKFMAHLKERGIGTAIHYPRPIYAQPAYAFLNVDSKQYPETERQASRIVSLPMIPELTSDEIDAVVDAVNSYA